MARVRDDARMAQFHRVTFVVRNKAQHKLLKRLSKLWAEDIERETGVVISRPMSKYLQNLVDRDARERGVE